MTGIARYGTGTDTLCLGSKGGCLSPDGALATRLWPLLDGTATGQPIDEIVTGGLTGLAPVVLFEVDEIGLRLLVRGYQVTVATAEGDITVDGRAVRTWAEQVVAGGHRVTVGDSQEQTWSLRSGVVQAGGFSWSATGDFLAEPAVPAIENGGPDSVVQTVATEVPAGAAPEVPAAVAADVPTAAADEPAIAAPAAEPPTALPPTAVPPSAVPPTAEPEPVVVAGPPATELSGPATIYTRAGDVTPPPPPPPPSKPEVVVRPAQAAAVGDTRLPDQDDAFDHLFGSTQLRAVQDAAVPEPVAAEGEPTPAEMTDPGVAPSAAVGRGDHDGSTILAGQLAVLRAEAERRATAPPPPPAALELALSTGAVVPLDQTVIVGRLPQASGISGRKLPALVTVPSSDGGISRSHLRLQVDGSAVTATDLNSTNGTLLRRANGSEAEIRNGGTQSVAAGDVLDLGDGVVLTIRAAR